MLIENVEGYRTYIGATLQPQGKVPGQRDTTKNHRRLGGIRQTPGYLQKQPSHLPEETDLCTTPVCCHGAETWTLAKKAQNKLTAAQTKLKRRTQHHIHGQKDQHLDQPQDESR